MMSIHFAWIALYTLLVLNNRCLAIERISKNKSQKDHMALEHKSSSSRVNADTLKLLRASHHQPMAKYFPSILIAKPQTMSNSQEDSMDEIPEVVARASMIAMVPLNGEMMTLDGASKSGDEGCDGAPENPMGEKVQGVFNKNLKNQEEVSEPPFGWVYPADVKDHKRLKIVEVSPTMRRTRIVDISRAPYNSQGVLRDILRPIALMEEKVIKSDINTANSNKRLSSRIVGDAKPSEAALLTINSDDTPMTVEKPHEEGIIAKHLVPQRLKDWWSGTTTTTMAPFSNPYGISSGMTPQQTNPSDSMSPYLPSGNGQQTYPQPMNSQPMGSQPMNSQPTSPQSQPMQAQPMSNDMLPQHGQQGMSSPMHNGNGIASITPGVNGFFPSLRNLFDFSSKKTLKDDKAKAQDSTNSFNILLTIDEGGLPYIGTRQKRIIPSINY